MGGSLLDGGALHTRPALTGNSDHSSGNCGSASLVSPLFHQRPALFFHLNCSLQALASRTLEETWHHNTLQKSKTCRTCLSAQVGPAFSPRCTITISRQPPALPEQRPQWANRSCPKTYTSFGRLSTYFCSRLNTAEKVDTTICPSLPNGAPPLV